MGNGEAVDAISTLIRMARLEGAVDVRCLLAGRHVMDNPAAAPGRVPFHLLLEGSCVAEVGGHSVELHAGDVLVLPRAESHRIHVTAGGASALPAELREGRVLDTLSSEGPPAVDLFCGHYTYRPGAGELLFGGLPEIVLASFGTGTDSPLRLLGELMRGEAGLEGPGAGALLAALCEALFALVLRGNGATRLTTSLPAPWTAAKDPGLRAVIDAVVHQPQRPWTIAELARVAGVSRATLVRRFAAFTGMGVADFLTRIRMTIAADLLATTDRSLDSIADAAGYASTSAFGRTFRLATGTTPAAFRRATARDRS